MGAILQNKDNERLSLKKIKDVVNRILATRDHGVILWSFDKFLYWDKNISRITEVEDVLSEKDREVTKEVNI